MRCLLILSLAAAAAASAFPGEEQLPRDAACNKRTAISWTNAADLHIYGKAFNDTATIYQRLPAAAKAQVRPEIWGLQTQPAGQFVQFTTDASCIFVRYSLGCKAGAKPPSMWHFPSTGVAGMDLYR